MIISFTDYTCPYNDDVRCNGRCYRSDDVCYEYQKCPGNEIINCGKSMYCYIYLCIKQ